MAFYGRGTNRKSINSNQSISILLAWWQQTFSSNPLSVSYIVRYEFERTQKRSFALFSSTAHQKLNEGKVFIEGGGVAEVS